MSMEQKLIDLCKPIDDNEVDLRIGNVSAGKGFSILLYKDSRADVRRFNKVFGTKWQTDYSRDEKGILKCKLSIWDDEIKEWVSRTDAGVESYTEKSKGEYSDAFKRAGFRWGFGIELYDAPFIWINWDKWNGKKPLGFFPASYKWENGKIIDRKSGSIFWENGSSKQQKTSSPKKKVEKPKYKPTKRLSDQDKVEKYQKQISEGVGKLHEVKAKDFDTPERCKMFVTSHLSKKLSECNVDDLDFLKQTKELVDAIMKKEIK